LYTIKLYKNGQFELFKSKKPEFIIGRAADCDIVFTSDVISRQHLKVVLTDKEIMIIDLKSANGTYKNGQKIESQVPHSIKITDKIRLGNMKEEIALEMVAEPAKIEEKSSGIEVEKAPDKQNMPAQTTPLPPKSPPSPRAPVMPISVSQSHVISLQEVSKKAEEIITAAKKKAREILTTAEEDAAKSTERSIANAESIIRDAKEQALQTSLNADETSKLLVQKAKSDAEKIIESAQQQSRQMINKAIAEVDQVIKEAQRKGESQIKTKLLEIESQKIKLKQDWIEEEKKLRNNFSQKKEEDLNELKNHLFSEREKIRQEVDEKRNAFAEELIKKQEILKNEEDLSKKRLEKIENEIELLVKKENQLKNDYAQKSLQLKIQHDEEKSRAELLLSDLKKKYDEEIEIYKKKEMERINHLLKVEQDSFEEKNRMQALQMRFTIKKLVAGIIDSEFGKYVEKEQLSLALEKVSNQIDKMADNVQNLKKEQEHKVVLETEKNVQMRSSKVTTFVGLAVSIVLIAVFTFWEPIYDSIRNNETYSKYVFNKMQADSVYVPIQSKDWKETYFERVLYLKDYVDFKTNQLYMDKWTQHLTNVENARLLKLSEDDMIRFLAREVNLINQLAALQNTIDARQLQIGLAKLKSAEDEAYVDFEKILKSKENFQKVMDWEKQFVTEHMSRLQQQRLPSDSK
jgi:pSer/pThr/pTyr-binding forkhead associated (FHA) protein